MIQIELPWPNSRLSPNARVHYQVLAKEKKAAKEQAYYLVRQQVKKIPFLPEGNIPISITFYPPDKRRRDDDNCIASCKALRDGVALALCVDDFRFRPVTYSWGDPVKGGKVVFEIQEL